MVSISSKSFGKRRPTAAHHEIEGEGRGENVVLVKLGRADYSVLVEVYVARLRDAQARDDGGERRFSSSGGSFEKETIACGDSQITAAENGFGAVGVMEDDVVRFYCRFAWCGLFGGVGCCDGFEFRARRGVE